MTSSRSDRPIPSGPRAEHPPPRVVQAFFPGGRVPVRWLLASASSLAADLAASAYSGPAARARREVRAFAPPAGLLDGDGDGGAGRLPQALPPSLQRRMEAFFGHDFSEVRIHVGSQATSIGALAFTLGTDIYFAPGHYQPLTRYGQQLLGRELAHVVQQREGRVPNPLGDGVAVVQDATLEDEAEQMGAAVAAQPSQPARPTHRARLGQPGAHDGPRRAGAAGFPALPAAQPWIGYQLIVGAYLHDEPYPEPLAGHSFIAIQDPDGTRRAFGFSPANFAGYDPYRDLEMLTSGVEGVVHDDDGAFAKPGVKTRAFAIDEAQAVAAMAKVDEYRAGRHRFSLAHCQCSAFALDVLYAARVEALGAPRVRPPREMYRKL